MKIEVDDDNEILLTEVYTGVGLKTDSGEILNICMRDSGYEFKYMGTWYEAKNGTVQKMDSGELNVDTNADTCSCCSGCSNC
jgi:hypothetical protein